MHPQKADKVIREYAQENGIDPDDMVYIMTSLYQYAKDIMGTFEHNMIRMLGLGTFFFRVWKIEDEVKKCNAILRQGKLPVHVLNDIQDRKQELIYMDSIILTEMNRRCEKREALKTGEHIPSKSEYIYGCRCSGCKKAHANTQAEYLRGKKGKKEREQYRLQKLQEYESKR